MDNTLSRIETESEISAYIDNMKYALDHGAMIQFQEKRVVDQKRDIKYTNAFTVRDLFPNENPAVALRRELKKLTTRNYLRTVRDIRYPNRSEMREFGKTYQKTKDVYIKIRIEMFDPQAFGSDTVFVMSFHFAEIPFENEFFPYLR